MFYLYTLYEMRAKVSAIIKQAFWCFSKVISPHGMHSDCGFDGEDSRPAALYGITPLQIKFVIMRYNWNRKKLQWRSAVIRLLLSAASDRNKPVSTMKYLFVPSKGTWEPGYCHLWALSSIQSTLITLTLQIWCSQVQRAILAEVISSNQSIGSIKKNPNKPYFSVWQNVHNLCKTHWRRQLLNWALDKWLERQINKLLADIYTQLNFNWHFGTWDIICIFTAQQEISSWKPAYNKEQKKKSKCFSSSNAKGLQHLININ